MLFTVPRQSSNSTISSTTSPLTRAIKQYIVILHMTKTLFQPVKVVGEILHTEDQSSIGAESQGVILHDVIYLDQFSNICIQVQLYKNTLAVFKHKLLTETALLSTSCIEFFLCLENAKKQAFECRPISSFFSLGWCIEVNINDK